MARTGRDEAPAQPTARRRSRPSLRDDVAGVCASLVAFGWAGWYVAFGLVGDPPARGGLFGLVGTALLAAVLGWFIGSRLVRPLDAATARLRRGLSAIRIDNVAPVAAIRRELAIVRATAPLELLTHLEVLDHVVGVVEERQSRETAWLAATIHDQRAPLIGWANLLSTHANSERPAWDDRPHLDLEGIARDLRGQAATFQRILEVVRLERADVAAHRTEEDLRALVDRVVARSPARPGIAVRVDGAGRASVDVALLERAVGNLVENAMRYARSHVDLDVFPNLVRVKDDGPGLGASLEVLTEPFRSTPPTGGLPVPSGAAGIGLSVVQRILELHGGRLTVEMSDGAGTTLLAYLGAGNRNA
jgi:signal transduction histidine kinase